MCEGASFYGGVHHQRLSFFGGVVLCALPHLPYLYLRFYFWTLSPPPPMSEAALLDHWSIALPPTVDLSREAAQWLLYNQLQKKWRQRELEPVVNEENCMLIACDTKRGEASKCYLASGFDVFWQHYQPTFTRADAGMQLLNKVRTARGQQPPDTPYTASQQAAVTAAERYACDASYYEMVVPNKPCHLAFDIEYYHNTYNQRPFEQLVDMFLSLLSQLFLEYYGLDDIRKHWHEAWTDSSNDEKVSRHLIIRLPCQLMMADMLHCGALTRRLACMAIREYGEPEHNPLFVAGADGSRPGFVPTNDSLVVFWDPLIYTRFRALRMVGLSKIGKFRFFFPLLYGDEETTVTTTSNNTATDTLDTDDMVTNEPSTYTTRSYTVGGVKDITREFFLTTLVHSPCDRPEQTRLLYASEPDGRTCFSTTLIPTHRQARYVLHQHLVGRAGSIPMGSSMHHSNANEDNTVAPRAPRSMAQNLHGVDDPNNLEWQRFKYDERLAYAATTSTTTNTTDQSTREMTMLLLDACDELVPRLYLPAESRGTSTRALHYQQYYRIHCKERVALVQLAHHYCPLSQTTHENNHMRYLIQLQPYDQIQPRYRAACFKCRSSYKDFAPLPFWNDDWRARLERVEQLELQQYQRPAYKLFGFMASALWSNEGGCASDDEGDASGDDV